MVITMLKVSLVWLLLPNWKHCPFSTHGYYLDMLNWEYLDLLKPRIVYGKSKIIQYPWGSIRSVFNKNIGNYREYVTYQLFGNTVNVAGWGLDRMWQCGNVAIEGGQE